MWIEFFGFVVCFFLIIQYKWNRKFSKLNAPSFYSFPILGHLPYFVKYIGKGIHCACNEWKAVLGPVFRLDFASYSAIILNDYKLIKDAFNIPALSGRFLLPVINVRMGGDGKRRGIIFNDDNSWIEQRRFALRQLKDFGFGKSSMENIILDECAELVQNFRKDVGKPISTQARFNAAIINSLWTIIAGQRFQHDDPKLAELVACVMQNLTSSGGSGAMVFMPTLTKWFPKLMGWKAYVDSFNITRSFIESFVNSRLQLYKEGVINDFTDAYIEEIKKTTNPQSSFYKKEGVKNLMTTLDDMFSAGGETTSTTLTWACLFLAKHPKIQEKLYSEIETVIGNTRMPSLIDRASMPYCEAVISEVLRKSSVVPVGVLHYSKEDVNLHGTLILKDMVIIANIHGVHHDAETWGDPEIFRPERFLSANGKSTVKHERLIPFSVGKRICPGENLARTELFFVITSIFQVFKVILDPGSPMPNLDPFVNGIVALPQPHNLIFYER